MKYFMKKIEKMLKSENDDVALQNRILDFSVILNSKNKRTKNGGVLGEEIFCPQVDGFSCPPPTGRRALDFSGISDKMSLSGVV